MDKCSVYSCSARGNRSRGSHTRFIARRLAVSLAHADLYIPVKSASGEIGHLPLEDIFIKYIVYKMYSFPCWLMMSLTLL